MDHRETDEENAWFEWKEKCAVDNCSKSSASVLKKRIKKTYNNVFGSDYIGRSAEPYMVFEEHCYINKTKEDKTYKEYFWEKILGNIKKGESGLKAARGLCRSFIISSENRERLNYYNKKKNLFNRDNDEDCYKSRNGEVYSLLNERNRKADSFLPEYFLKNGLDIEETMTERYRSNVDKTAQCVLDKMNVTEKMVMLAFAAGLRPTGEEFLSIAPKKSSAINSACRKISECVTLKKCISDHFGKTEKEELKNIMHDVLLAVSDNIFEYMNNNQESECEGLLEAIKPYFH